MAFHVRLRPSAEKDLDRLDSRYRTRILAALATLEGNPYIGKKLRGEREGQWSFRVWPYRILYEIYNRELVIIVIRIAHRQGVY